MGTFVHAAGKFRANDKIYAEFISSFAQIICIRFNGAAEGAAPLPDVASISFDVATTSPDVGSASPDVASTSSDVATTLSDAASTLSDVATTLSDVASTSSDAASASSDVAVKCDDFGKKLCKYKRESKINKVRCNFFKAQQYKHLQFDTSTRLKPVKGRTSHRKVKRSIK